MESGDSLVFVDVKNILLNYGYRKIRPLSSGGFGDILSAVSRNKDPIAIKIIKNEKSWPLEERIWPTLKHRNVLPLLDVIDIDYLNLRLYVMPKHPFVLDNLTCTKEFLSDETALCRMKSWLNDVLDGLHYMHSTGFAHLDVKSDNVLITSEDRALLCDYSGIDVTGVPLRRLCSPPVYRPPEYYDAHQDVEGTSTDIWLFGLMTLQVLTGHWPALNMKQVTSAKTWKKNVEPVLKKALKKKVFFDLMKKAFPSVDLSLEELSSAHDFVLSVMKWNAVERLSIAQMKCHPFLANSENQSAVNERQSSTDNIETVVSNPVLKRCINSDNAQELKVDEKSKTAKTENLLEKKNFGQKIKKWVAKKWNMTFRRKKNYVILSEEYE